MKNKITAIFNFLISLIKDPEARKQFIKYLITGFSAFGIEYLLFLVLSDFIIPQSFEQIIFGIKIDAVNVAQSVSMFIATVYVFILNRLWSFKSKEPLLPEVVKFGILFVFNLIATNIVITLLIGAGIPKGFSKILVQGMVVCWNFFLYRFIIFRKKTPKGDEK